jgi:hypothetical protein
MFPKGITFIEKLQMLLVLKMEIWQEKLIGIDHPFLLMEIIMLISSHLPFPKALHNSLSLTKCQIIILMPTPKLFQI